MYAIIEDSGSQMKVSEGDLLTIDTRALDEGAETLKFDRVLMIGGEGEPTVGEPYLAGATVDAEIVDASVKGPKIDVIKFKRRKGYRRKQGHRQPLMTVRVKSINAG